MSENERHVFAALMASKTEMDRRKLYDEDDKDLTLNDALEIVQSNPEKVKFLLKDEHVSNDLDEDEVTLKSALKRVGWRAEKCPKIIRYLALALVECQIREKYGKSPEEISSEWAQEKKVTTIREAILEAESILEVE